MPSQKIHNEDIIELASFYSLKKYHGHIDELQTLIRRFLKLTGSNTRFWRSPKEKAIDLIDTACRRALKMAGIESREIDLVIYSAIDRGFIEPSNASFLCKSLGMSKARCFDIVDACMGWNTAVQTIDSFFKSDESLEYAMIINSEFPMDQKGTIFPNNFTIKEKNELKWKIASFTIGEAASISIFKRDNSIINHAVYIEDSEQVDLCSIPLINFEKFLSSQIPENQFEMQFYADMASLLEKGLLPSVDVLEKLFAIIESKPNIIFPHSVSKKAIEKGITSVNINIPFCSTFPELGNLATASIPSAITKTLLNKEIERNSKCVSWVASAGMKYSAIEISL